MIIDGRALAQQLNEQTRSRTKQLLVKPLLVDIVVGDDPVSLSYVRIKEKKAFEVGFDFELHHLPKEATTEQVLEKIASLVARSELCGLIIQLPLPATVDSEKILSTIPSEVDVDLLNPNTIIRFYQGEPTLVPPTAGAIMHIIDSLSVDWPSKQILVLGQGDLVGKPTTHLLKQAGLNVVTADGSTTDTGSLLATADVIISGVGKSALVKGEQVKQDVIVIDAGTSEASGTITGDMDYESVAPKASYITPVPGGVGPVTVAKLLENVVIVAEQK